MNVTGNDPNYRGFHPINRMMRSGIHPQSTQEATSVFSWNPSKTTPQDGLGNSPQKDTLPHVFTHGKFEILGSSISEVCSFSFKHHAIACRLQYSTSASHKHYEHTDFNVFISFDSITNDRQVLHEELEPGGKREEGGCPCESSMPGRSYNFRARGAKQSKLAYDQKYHPMDDSLRPTRAAKRRRALVEPIICLTEASESDTRDDQSPHSGNKVAEKLAKVSPNRQQEILQCLYTPTTRRSPRIMSRPKDSYNTNMHPQDEALELLSDKSCDMEISNYEKKKRKLNHADNDTSMLESPGCRNSETRAESCHSCMSIETTQSDDTYDHRSVESLSSTRSADFMENVMDICVGHGK